MTVKIASPPVQPRPRWWEQMNYGAFVSYAYGAPKTNETIYPNGTLPASVSELATNFDVPNFVSAMVAYGVQYVIFLAWHIAMNAVYPSAVMQSFLGASNTASRDLISDLAVALKAQGIKFIPYVHFTDYTDLTTAQKAQIGASPYNQANYNALVQGLASEMATRYGNLVDGFWIDMVFQADFTQMIDTKRLRANLLKGNQRRLIIGNDGANWDTAATIGNGMCDYVTHEYYPTGLASGWAATAHQTIPLFANTGVWWASATSGSGDVTRDTAANIFKFNVMQIASAPGGICWGLNPYAGINGAALFEDGVDAKMKAIWALISPIKASLIGVQRSPSWVLVTEAANSYVQLSTLPTGGLSSRFCATLAANGRTDFIHVLTAPSSGKTITLPAPADGAAFSAATNLRTGNACVLVTNGDSTITITLNASDSWDANDTVIALTPSTTRPCLTAPIALGG